MFMVSIIGRQEIEEKQLKDLSSKAEHLSNKDECKLKTSAENASLDGILF